MKIARKVVTLLIVAVLVCALPVTAALAAESGSLWAAIECGENTTVLVVADAAVTDGVVKLTYDSTVLTYESVEVTDEYVAMYAVNAEEPGTVLISWVAPGGYSLTDGAVCLFRVHFSGTEEESSLVLSGTAHGADGTALDVIGAPDTADLADAIADAEALEEKAYTGQTWSVLAAALADAKDVLMDATATQAEVDAAEKALRDAVAGLVKVPATEEDPTESSSTQATEDPSESVTTRPTEDSGDNADTGDGSQIWLFVVILVVSAGAIVVLLIKMKKKGGDAE